MIKTEILTFSMDGDSSLGDRIIEQGVLEVIHNYLAIDRNGNYINSNKDQPYFVHVGSMAGGLDKFVRDIVSLSAMFPDAKYESFYLAYGYDGLCNLAFSPETLERIGRLGANLLVSCWEVENPDTSEDSM